MPATPFAAELAELGPQGRAPAATRAAAERYCRRLAQTHYENFTVASWLLPRRLRPHFHHVYAYCRWADDLADEASGPEESERLLDWWEGELRDCYAGHARHPVFVALRSTIDEFDIPIEPFADLLIAFRQDQRVRRYETFGQLLDYCRNSANPVGRLVLYLGRAHDAERGALSDSVCTGLQLANFWQDVARDQAIGRVYMPAETLRRFALEPDIFGPDKGDATLSAEKESRPLLLRTATPAFRAALAYEVERAEGFLRAGMPLVARMPQELRAEIWLFIQGGLKILEHIRRLDYDVWSRRPEVTKRDKLGLLAGYVGRRWGLVRGAAS